MRVSTCSLTPQTFLVSHVGGKGPSTLASSAAWPADGEWDSQGSKLCSCGMLGHGEHAGVLQCSPSPQRFFPYDFKNCSNVDRKTEYLQSSGITNEEHFSVLLYIFVPAVSSSVLPAGQRVLVHRLGVMCLWQTWEQSPDV